MSNPSHLFLLADHIKLSLLERQRAISLNLEPNTQDGQISRSLDTFRDGLDAIEAERERLEQSGDASAATALQEQETLLQKQFDDLTSQFRGFSTTTPSSITHPNDPSLSADFSRATDAHPRNTSSSFLKRSTTQSPKTVRFTDNPSADPENDDANRAALFPYRDEPEDTSPDQENLTNTQIHAYHSQVLRDQDEQLDRLGESIGRQRDLSIQIGDELDSHVQMLDEVDEHVDRHQSRLDNARNRLGKVARKAKDNVQLTIILILTIILVLLIIVLK